MGTMKAMKVSKVAKGSRMKAAVFLGAKEKTYTGLKKSDLVKAKSGKIATKKQVAVGKKSFKYIKKWVECVKSVRSEMKITGFKAIKKGTPFYKAVKAAYDA